MRIKIEVNRLIDTIKEFDGNPFNISTHLYRSLANVMFTILLGERFDDEDPLLNELLKRGHEVINSLGQYATSAYKYIPGDPFQVRKFMKNEKRLLEILSDTVDEHLDNYKGGTPTNFIDVYIKEMRESEGTNRIMNKHELVSMLSLMVSGGTDTTPNALLWGILFMLHDPSVQEKVARELDNVIPGDRAPNISDQKRLPYVEATINETFRRASIIPITSPLVASRKTTVNGYDIPTDAYITPCLDSVFFDETLWREPEVFRPSRFLNDDGSVKHVQELIPFSLGKRRCPAEPLARMQFFLYFTTLVQNFEFKSPEEREAPSLESSFGVVLVPDDFTIQAIPRQKSY